MATAVTSMRIPTELNERYSRLAKETGRSRSFYVNEAPARSYRPFRVRVRDSQGYRGLSCWQA